MGYFFIRYSHSKKPRKKGGLGVRLGLPAVNNISLATTNDVRYDWATSCAYNPLKITIIRKKERRRVGRNEFL